MTSPPAPPTVVLGRTGLRVSRLGFGAFKIGRNTQVRYADAYDLPDDDTVRALLAGLVEAGITYFDTAPAYGTSEQRLGRLLPQHPAVVVSTKVGEFCEDGRYHYDFSREAIIASVERSRRRLGRDVLDLVLLHSNRDEHAVLHQHRAHDVLAELRDRGWIRWIGFSGYTVAALRDCLGWADVLMVEYHRNQPEAADLIAEAAAAGLGIVVKKGLDSGNLPPHEGLPFLAANPAVHTVVIGSLSLEHMVHNAGLLR